MSTGLYVHVPVCAYRCPYCDFNVWTPGQFGDESERALPRTFRALVRETRWLLDKLAEEPDAPRLETLYFGGGTPSAAPLELFEELIGAVRAAAHAPEEVTLEANPESFSPERLDAWMRAGVNRVSLGTQSFSDETLRRLGRRHDVARSRAALGALQAVPLRSWNADLIYGVAGQTPEGFSREIDELLSHRPPHVSLYALEIHRNTDFGRRAARGESPAASDDFQAELFDLARARLGGAGYEHYELSNFALPGHEAAHNSAYWRRERVPAVGPGAWGNWRDAANPHGIRYQVPRAPEPYWRWAEAAPSGAGVVAAVRAGGVEAFEALTDRRALAEELFLGLRLLAEGVALAPLRARYGQALVAEKLGALEKFRERGWVRHREGRLFLAPERALVANAVFTEIVEAP